MPLTPPEGCKPGDRVVVKGYEHETSGGWFAVICLSICVRVCSSSNPFVSLLIRLLVYFSCLFLLRCVVRLGYLLTGPHLGSLCFMKT